MARDRLTALQVKRAHGGLLKHPAVPRRCLDKYMFPEFGDTVAADITPAMAARLLARVGKKAPTAANDLLRHMRRVFRFAVRRHLMASSPAADFNLSNAGGQETARQRSLRALHVDIDTLNAALAGVDHSPDEFTIHDLRRNMRTHLSSLDIRSEVAERKAALETWTALLLEIGRGERKVAPMRSRRSNL